MKAAIVSGRSNWMARSIVRAQKTSLSG